MTSQNSWAESFPPKLDSSVIDQLKAKFLASYPSELVNHDTMPSTRLLSLVHHQLLKKQWAWIPWKYRLTMAKADEISSQRQTKMPKLEVASLHNLLVDEPPSIDIHPASRGVAAHTAGLFRSVRGAKGGFPPWELFKLRSFNKKSFRNIVFDSVFPMFPVKQTVIYTFFAIKAVNPSKTLLLTVFL